MIASNYLLVNTSHPNIFCAHSPPINIQKSFTFFVSDENSGWLPISLLLIISFSFDLNYDCSVRHTHLFIFLAGRDELFGDCTDWRTLKWLQKQAGVLWEFTHGSCFYFYFFFSSPQVLHLQLPAVWSSFCMSIMFLALIFLSLDVFA